MVMELDLRGLYCPMPVFRTREEIMKVPIGGTINVIADDPAAAEDIPRWAKRSGNEVLDVKKDGEEVRILIRRLK